MEEMVAFGQSPDLFVDLVVTETHETTLTRDDADEFGPL